MNAGDSVQLLAARGRAWLICPEMLERKTCITEVSGGQQACTEVPQGIKKQNSLKGPNPGFVIGLSAAECMTAIHRDVVQSDLSIEPIEAIVWTPDQNDLR